MNQNKGGNREEGAIMVLTLVLLVIVAVVVTALLESSSSNLSNIANFQVGRNYQDWSNEAVESAISEVVVAPQRYCGNSSAITVPGFPLPAYTPTNPNTHQTSAGQVGAVNVSCEYQSLGNNAFQITLTACPQALCGGDTSVQLPNSSAAPYLQVVAVRTTNSSSVPSASILSWTFANQQG